MRATGLVSPASMVFPTGGGLIIILQIFFLNCNFSFCTNDLQIRKKTVQEFVITVGRVSLHSTTRICPLQLRPKCFYIVISRPRSKLQYSQLLHAIGTRDKLEICGSVGPSRLNAQVLHFVLFSEALQ